MKETPLIKVGETTRIGTEVRKTLWKKFKRMVKKQYGHTKWFLSYEVNEALDLYLRVKLGELIVFDAVYLKDHGDYAYTHGHIYSSESFVVRKFKEKFKDSERVHKRELQKFVLDDCGWASRTKFYDVRDELLGKGFISYFDDKKRIFLIDLNPRMDYSAMAETFEELK